jgi:choline dehydrogenase-like flavoprotein
MTQETWDVVIIGTGAGGGTLAQRLASTGKRVLLVERGDFLPRERENWDIHEVIDNARYRAHETFVDRDDRPFRPFTHYWVGGNTKLYGAALLRLRESDFRETRHADGISPAWPIEYAELEPYYTQAEALYSVHGRHGVDPCGPPASEQYRHGPVPHEPRIAALAERFTAIGLRPFPLPLGVRLPQDRNGARAALHLGLFDGFPDPTESKADAHVVGVNAALEHPNVSLWTQAYVERLHTSHSGREVTSVRVRRGLETIDVRANVVVAACGAIQSAALCLRSRDDAHPRGLGNARDLVGRHYMCHNNGALIAYSDELNTSQFQKTFAITDYYHRGRDVDSPLGTIQLMGRSDPRTLLGCFAQTLPMHTAEQLAEHTVDFWLTTEDLPRPNNRITWTRDRRVRITYDKTNARAYARLKQTLMRDIERAEPDHAHVFGSYELGIDGTSHQCGTMRFGHDPETSVLDSNCRVHGIDNLYVVDSSFFCSSGAVNPSLTIMANALRVGDHLAERLR